jgi:hypothetical protein
MPRGLLRRSLFINGVRDVPIFMSPLKDCTSGFG